MKDLIQPQGLRLILKGTISTIAIESGLGGLMRLTQHIRSHLSHVLDPVARHKQILPAVLISIEKPAGKTVHRFADPGLASDIHKTPELAFSRNWTGIAKELIGGIVVGNIKIQPSIVIDICHRGCLDVRGQTQTTCSGLLGERAILIVDVKFGSMTIAWSGFIAHKKVQPSIIVHVPPNGGLRRITRKHSSFIGHIFKMPLAVVLPK